MKTFFLFSIISIALILNVEATVWRVNSTAGTDADFASVQTAHNNANPGDTLYLEPSAANYGDFTLSKKLIIIGNGYFIDENPETQADINYSQLNAVSFNPGSEESVIQGCKIFYVRLKTSEIIIQRNYIAYNSDQYATILFDSDNIANIIIRDNYLYNSFSTTGYPYPTSEVIKSEKNGVSNIIISNNLIDANDLYTYHHALDLTSGFGGSIKNNVIYGNSTLNNSMVNNNIYRDGSLELINCSYINNISNSDQFGFANNNQGNVTMESVFVGTGSTDGQWQLKEASPAVGGGVGGIDCGMFGGDFPYVLSGIPAIPAIYELNHNIDYQNQQIELDISVKSHN